MGLAAGGGEERESGLSFLSGEELRKRFENVTTLWATSGDVEIPGGGVEGWLSDGESGTARASIGV